MIITTHAITGAAIASVYTNPYLSVPLAFASHFLLDGIPHYDPHVDKVDKSKKFISLMFLDLISAVGVSAVLYNYTQNTYLIFGVVAASVMDLDVVVHLRKSIPKIFPRKLSRYHRKIQNETQDVVYGLSTQLLVILIGLEIILFQR